MGPKRRPPQAGKASPRCKYRRRSRISCGQRAGNPKTAGSIPNSRLHCSRGSRALLEFRSQIPLFRSGRAGWTSYISASFSWRERVTSWRFSLRCADNPGPPQARPCIRSCNSKAEGVLSTCGKRYELRQQLAVRGPVAKLAADSAATERGSPKISGPA